MHGTGFFWALTAHALFSGQRVAHHHELRGFTDDLKTALLLFLPIIILVKNKVFFSITDNFDDGYFLPFLLPFDFDTYDFSRHPLFKKCQDEKADMSFLLTDIKCVK